MTNQFHVPSGRPATEAGEQTSTEERSSPETPPRVLVVEDEVILRTLLVDELGAAGFPALEAGAADEALSHLEFNPGVRLVITDLQMPGPVGGKDLVRAIRARFPAIKVLILSAFAPDPELARLAAGSFVKPVDMELIVQSTRLLLKEWGRW